MTKTKVDLKSLNDQDLADELERRKNESREEKSRKNQARIIELISIVRESMQEIELLAKESQQYVVVGWGGGSTSFDGKSDFPEWYSSSC